MREFHHYNIKDNTIVLIRGYGLCILLNKKYWGRTEPTFYNRKMIINANNGGISDVHSYKNGPNQGKNPDAFDILAYKQMLHQADAVFAVMNNDTPSAWTWSSNPEIYPIDDDTSEVVDDLIYHFQ